jgi:N-methylhydantoinase B/acetone carboxylase alpha subunit
MGDVEAWELLEPLLYTGRNIRPNSAGPGKYRGGLGLESIRMVYGTKKQNLFHVGYSHVFPAGGLFGGYPSPTLYRHCLKNTDIRERIAKKAPYPVRDMDSENSEIMATASGDELRDKNMCHLADEHSEYDIYLSLIAGGNGLGDSLERDPSLVAKDLNDLYLLPRYAEGIYGVIAIQDANGKWIVDNSATTKKREELRKERLERSQTVEEWMEGERPQVANMEFIYPVRDMYQQSMELSENFTREFKTFWDLTEDWNPWDKN